MNEIGERIGIRMVGLLLIIAAVSVIGLWTLDTSVVSGESLFAVYLSMDLVAFAMISYVYRVVKGGDNVRQVPLLAGLFMLLVLILAGLSF